jgi:Tfp pilus assembly pilus retraction ATPase PilT
VAAMEIMPVTSTIRDCIRDPDRMDEISDLIEEGREHYGSQTFDQHLMELVKSGLGGLRGGEGGGEQPGRLRPQDEHVGRA